MPTPLHHDSIDELTRRIHAGDVSAVEVTEHYLRRIEQHDSALHAYLYVDAEGALAQAATVDRKRAAGQPLGPLAGVPIALKDNLCTRGVPTTCASRVLQGYVPPYDATVVRRLREADAVLIGKTNLDEFAMGSSTENSAMGVSRNPWDLERAPGGSSGGSAVAAAAGLALGTLGSDTGGSVRQPGSFCGVAAIKPTYGRVSRYGLVAFASSLDQVGPIARTMRDTAHLFQAIAGYDPHDPTTTEEPTADYVSACGQPVGGLRVGVVRSGLQGVDADVARAMEHTLQALTSLGVSLVDIELPHASHSVATYYLVAPAEASSNLARFDGMRYGVRVTGDDLEQTYCLTRAQGFGPEVKRRIMLGTYALSAGYYDAFYLKAQKVRTLIRNDYDAAFRSCDVVLTPTTPTPAFRFGEKVKDPVAMYLADIFTLPPSLAGVPAVNVPCGMSATGLPIGVQFAAPPFQEATLIRVGHALEQSLQVVQHHPACWSEST
jgi:aspartyl-tRNA(Asn)/glutamyl-tRNA(Gln) amidotransferase subunit A